MVRVEDCGPFAAGRLMDGTAEVAQELEMKKRGVAPVEVKPIVVPQPKGEVRLGAGAAALTPQQVRQGRGRRNRWLTRGDDSGVPMDSLRVGPITRPGEFPGVLMQSPISVLYGGLM
jgi:rare lipoprotein A (peptidoglycan hydrolase)